MDRCQRCEALADQVGRLVTERDQLAASLDATKQERDKLAQEVELFKEIAGNGDKLLKLSQAEVERFKHGPPELLTMMIEADHMLGAYSTTRIALKEFLRKYAGMSLQIEDWKAYVKLLAEELDEIVGVAHSRGWRSTRYEEGKQLREKLGIKKPTD